MDSEAMESIDMESNKALHACRIEGRGITASQNKRKKNPQQLDTKTRLLGSGTIAPSPCNRCRAFARHRCFHKCEPSRCTTRAYQQQCVGTAHIMCTHMRHLQARASNRALEPALLVASESARQHDPTSASQHDSMSAC